MNEIKAIRDDLKRAAENEPESAQPLIATLDKQLKGWAKGDSADHAALRPEIEKTIARIKRARAL